MFKSFFKMDFKGNQVNGYCKSMCFEPDKRFFPRRYHSDIRLGDASAPNYLNLLWMFWGHSANIKSDGNNLMECAGRADSSWQYILPKSFKWLYISCWDIRVSGWAFVRKTEQWVFRGNHHFSRCKISSQLSFCQVQICSLLPIVWQFFNVKGFFWYVKILYGFHKWNESNFEGLCRCIARWTFGNEIQEYWETFQNGNVVHHLA